MTAPTASADVQALLPALYAVNPSDQNIGAGSAWCAAITPVLYIDTSAPEIDVEDLVIAYLQPLVNAGQVLAVSARMPENPVMPFILVQRVAGGDDYIWDHATVSVHSFSNTQTSASDVARAAHHMMRALDPKVTVDVDGCAAQVTHIEVSETPMWRDYDDPLIMRYVARYLIDVRTPAIPRF